MITNFRIAFVSSSTSNTRIDIYNVYLHMMDISSVDIFNVDFSLLELLEVCCAVRSVRKRRDMARFVLLFISCDTVPGLATALSLRSNSQQQLSIAWLM